MRFTWDAPKETRNKQKHGLDFSFASLVFADPLRLIAFDRYEGGEDHWHCLGAAGSGFCWWSIATPIRTIPIWFG